MVASKKNIGNSCWWQFYCWKNIKKWILFTNSTLKEIVSTISPFAQVCHQCPTSPSRWPGTPLLQMTLFAGTMRCWVHCHNILMEDEKISFIFWFHFDIIFLQEESTTTLGLKSLAVFWAFPLHPKTLNNSYFHFKILKKNLKVLLN